MLSSRAHRLYSLTRSGSGGGAQVIEGLEIPVDFSDGDQVIAAPDGYVVKSATLKKPANLLPENIAKDVDVAGVIGTHEGGSGVGAGCVTVTFMNGDEIIFQRPVYIGDDCPDPISQTRIPTPTRESSVQYNYTYSGWATTDGGSVNNKALLNITADKTIYAAFSSSVREYTVRFYDGAALLHTEQVAYGGSSDYVYNKPDYAFDKWTPAPTNITGDLDCYGEWEESIAFADASWGKIAERSAAGTASTMWALGDEKSLTLTYSDGTTEDIVVRIAGFNHDVDGSGKNIGLTLMCKTLPNITATWKNTAIIYAGYASSIQEANGQVQTGALRTASTQTFYNALPSELRSLIKPAQKTIGYKYYNSNSAFITVTDTCWVPTSQEMGAKGSYAIGGGSAYALYTNATSRNCYQDGESVKYWVSDGNTSGSNIPWNFWDPNTFGGYYGYTSNSLTFPIIFGFCI